MPKAPPDRPALRRRLAAEGLGAFFVFATVIGSGIMAERLSAGNDGLALLTGAALAALAAKMLFGEPGRS